MHLTLDRLSAVSLVQQLTTQLQAWIEQQRLRQMAQRLGVAKVD